MKNWFFVISLLLGSHAGYTQACIKSQLPRNLQNGLVAFYPFCSNANDISGFGNNGIVTGATLTSDRFGRSNNAYSFNGTSSQIKVPKHTSLEPRDEISISCWILPQYAANEPSDININDATQIVRKGDASSPGYHLSWSNLNNKRLESHYYGSWGNIVHGTPNENYKNNWQHLVMTYSTKTRISRLFINGNLISSQACSNQLEHTDDLYIGGFRNYQFFKGKIDNIGIWNRELTLCEVRQLYNEDETSIPDSFNPLPDSTLICGKSITLDAGIGYTNYSWSNGQSTRNTIVNSGGWQKVTVTNATGCSFSDSTFVSIMEANILNNDTTICKAAPISLSIDSSFSELSSCSTERISSTLKKGLIGYFPFCGNTNDLSGNNNHGVNSGATLTTDRFNNPQSAYNFNGNSFITIPDNTTLRTANLTLSAWVYMEPTSPQGSFIISKVNTSNTTSGAYNIQVWDQSRTVTAFHNSGNCLAGDNNWQFLDATTSLLTRKWVHVVTTYSSDSIKLYVNGQLVNKTRSNRAALDLCQNSTINIGKWWNGDPRLFIGKIDDIAIWDRAITDNEVKELYTPAPTILWSTGATTNKITVSPSQSTTYYATITNGSHSCTDSVKININDIGVFNPLSDTTRTCGTSTVLNTGSEYSSYSWNTGASSQSISPITSGFYKVTVKNSSGCTASDSTYLSLVKANIINKDTTICKGTNITLSIDSIFPGKTICSSIGMSSSLRNGLVAFYPFCGNTSDQSGNANNGVAVGATLTTDRFGIRQSAYNFSGNSQYIYSNISSLPNNSRSTSIWFKASNPSNRGVLLGYGGNGNCGTSYFIGTNHRGSGRLMVTGHCNSNETSVLYTPPSSEWVHLVTTSSASGTKIYINGQLVATSNRQFNTTGSRLYIGANVAFDGNTLYTDGNGGFWIGDIDDVMIYNRELTISEIQELYKIQNAITWSTGETTNTIKVAPTQTTKYFVSITDGVTSCIDSVTVAVSTTDTSMTLSGPVIFCEGGNIALTANNNRSYQWYRNGNILSNAVGNSYIANSSGIYHARIISNSGCIDSTRKITVTVNTLPSGIIQSLSGMSICDDVPIQLTATGGTTYQWLLNGTLIPGANSSSYNASLPGTYTVELRSSDGCRKMADGSIVLNRYLRPTFDLSFNSRCTNNSISFLNNGNINSSGPLTYLWNFGDGTNSALANPQKTYTRPGIYTIQFSVTSAECPSFNQTITRTINIQAPVPGIRYPAINAIENSPTQLTARNFGLTYQWQPTTGLSSSTILNPTTRLNSPQEYQILIIDQAGCVTVDTQAVLLFKDINIYVPKAFTPNGDGSNDFLFPNLVGIRELKSFRVYNRWGILMFESKNQFPGWDGTFKSQRQPMETYTWVAEGIDIRGLLIKRSGNTLLIR